MDWWTGESPAQFAIELNKTGSKILFFLLHVHTGILFKLVKDYVNEDTKEGIFSRNDDFVDAKYRLDALLKMDRFHKIKPWMPELPDDLRNRRVDLGRRWNGLEPVLDKFESEIRKLNIFVNGAKYDPKLARSKQIKDLANEIELCKIDKNRPHFRYVELVKKLVLEIGSEEYTLLFSEEGRRFQRGVALTDSNAIKSRVVKRRNRDRTPSKKIISKKPVARVNTSQKDHHTSETAHLIQWDEIELIFKDGHTVRIKQKGRKDKVVDYKEMGFENRKNLLPNKAWNLLKVFAETGKGISWGDPKAKDVYKKRKQILANGLKYYFGAKNDPFYPYRKVKSYLPRFKVKKA